MSILDQLALPPSTPWVGSGTRADLPDVAQVAWDDVSDTLPPASQPAIVLDALGLSVDELVARFRALTARLQPTGQLAVVHGDLAAVLGAVRALHGDGWLARVADAGALKYFAFARGASTLPFDDYLALLWRQALLVAPAHGAGGAPRLAAGVHKLLNAETSSPAFRWMIDRTLGSAHVLARIGNARGARKRATVMTRLVARSLRETAQQLGKYTVQRVRALRPRVAPADKSALHGALIAEGAASPDSDGSRYYQPLPVRIGVVTDEFLYNGLKDAADVVAVTPDNFRGLELDLFLFVACWNGMGEWPQIGNHRSPMRSRLHEVIDHFNLRAVPTAFWSIEDPPHYDDFISVAQRCTHVYTTTVEKLDDYRRDCGNAHVGALPFGVNPLVHNPIGSGRPRRTGLFFAGSWYKQYPEREVDMANVFDGALRVGRELVLVDRCYLRGNPSFDFPSAYRPYTYPPIDHAPLQRVQKRFDWCLNFNSVKHSATMFANRVPELQAQGVAVLSNDSLSVDRMYPHVFTVTDADQVGPILDELSADELRAHQMLGVRAVMEDATYFDKVADVCRDVGLAVHVPPRKLLVVADELTERVRATFSAQVLAEPRRLVAASALTAALVAEHDFVAWWPADAAYGAFYLQDQLHAFKYTRARWVASAEPAHEYVDTLADKRGAMFAARELGFEALQGELRGPLAGGYLVPPVEAREPTAAPAELASARLTVVVAEHDAALRVWSKHVLPVRRRAGRTPVDVLVLDDGSIDPTQRAWLRRLAVQPGVKVAPLPAGPGSRATRAARAAATMVTTPYVWFVEAEEAIVHGALARLAPALTDGGEPAPIVGRVIDLATPPVRSPEPPTAARVVRTGPREAVSGALGPRLPPLSALILPTAWLRRDGGVVDPSDPVVRLELLARAERVWSTDVRLVAARPPAQVGLDQIAARTAGARDHEVRRLAALERLGLADAWLAERLVSELRAAYLDPIARARAAERPALRAQVRAALEPYRSRAARTGGAAARALAELDLALRDPG